MAFSANGSSGSDGLSSDINVTPLIDVLLVMLIIFMVIVPVMPRGLRSAIPSASPRSGEEEMDRPVLVDVERTETAARYVIDGADVAGTDVRSRLKEILSRRSRRSVLVKADAELDFEVVAEVINAGQSAGADAIGLVTPAVEAQKR